MRTASKYNPHEILNHWVVCLGVKRKKRSHRPFLKELTLVFFLFISVSVNAQINFNKWADVLIAAADTTSNVGKALDLIEHQIVDSPEVEIAEDTLEIKKKELKTKRIQLKIYRVDRRLIKQKERTLKFKKRKNEKSN